MEYHAIFHTGDYVCIVRPSNHGITDTEWERGCRILVRIDTMTQRELETSLENNSGYMVLNAQEWSEYISSLDEPNNVPNNNFINSRPVIDKWDGARPIY
jgi:hypothetical protein